VLTPYYKKNLIEAGCDEAGRGCLAGPVVAAAVILPFDYSNKLLNDSKKLTEKQRYSLRDIILKDSLDYAVAFVDNIIIDEMNILNASIQAMHDALKKLTVKPEYIIVDGNKFKPYQNIPHTCIVKGDSKYMSIASASILAKTFRDDFMIELHHQYPLYQWIQNKGYPVKNHREAIRNFGISPFHRITFNLLDSKS
jgi:ribonuclease HII